MQSLLVIVPCTEVAHEAARLVDVDAAPLASVLEPVSDIELAAFRDAVVGAALEHESGVVAGVLFAARWGGGGVMLT